MPVVKFTSNLRRFYPTLSNYKTEASSIIELVESVESSFPGIKSYLIDDQNALRKHVNIFINGTMIKDRTLLKDELASGDEVFIMQALSGG